MIHILDSELRLITPSDPHWLTGECQQVKPEVRHYQLTHDYLIHSLRDWLTRKQKETRRGRADLLLEERYSVWKIKKENRHLPSLPEWIMIVLYASKKKMSSDRINMLCCSMLYYLASSLLQLLVLIPIIGVFILGGFAWFGSLTDTRTGRSVYAMFVLNVIVVIMLFSRLRNKSNAKSRYYWYWCFAK